MKRTFVSTDAEATEALGEALGQHLPAGTVMTLDGDLGTGKTTLVRGLGRGLGLDEPISSPTYMLMQAYEGGRVPLYHFDAWMEGREKALLADGADEFLGAGGIAVVEWGSRVLDWLPEPRLEVTLGHRSPEERTISMAVIGGPGPLGAALEAVLERLGTPGAVAGLVPRENGHPSEPPGAPSVS
ncbi:tRNA threonylcarbamoyladenosine biosynthesis protein TsaE [Planctomycetes bacterium Poly30]|uniref:tRNA threonylcarbamoyladenosine biosynthesis protein TsaE n=1 Tax=Saltatorellus ferox TaxID=2528018 RepID=A0A518ETG8_9BACT|nr:tRNA threonylcarbamoyladenosine biosynthesis protein TsaE [Planctomycetes bacterium Poly30]